MTLILVMLLALPSGQRRQTIHTLKVDGVRVTYNKCVFSAVLKQTRARVHAKPLELRVFENKRLCVVKRFRQYLKITPKLRKGKQFLISFIKPYSEVTRDTISRWIKTVLNLAGIDIIQFSAGQQALLHSSTGACHLTALLGRQVGPIRTLSQGFTVNLLMPLRVLDSLSWTNL